MAISKIEKKLDKILRTVHALVPLVRNSHWGVARGSDSCLRQGLEPLKLSWDFTWLVSSLFLYSNHLICWSIFSLPQASIYPTNESRITSCSSAFFAFRGLSPPYSSPLSSHNRDKINFPTYCILIFYRLYSYPYGQGSTLVSIGGESMERYLYASFTLVIALLGLLLVAAPRLFLPLPVPLGIAPQQISMLSLPISTPDMSNRRQYERSQQWRRVF